MKTMWTDLLTETEIEQLKVLGYVSCSDSIHSCKRVFTLTDTAGQTMTLVRDALNDLMPAPRRVGRRLRTSTVGKRR